MESGAGRHWTEEEVKALLSVWAEKSIRKQLHGTLRNKGIFIYVAKRLQEMGICRDWKQCRAKYKNLKYEYRTVKYAHHSGDATKTMKFFHELDAILQHEPATQLSEEDNSRCSAHETIRENNEGKRGGKPLSSLLSFSEIQASW
uniref:Myb/SANT-like DNA-binding domain-containing protein n=1 Tax=Anolis carolinensis TaxID=28377 RepID=G1KUZ8_ANOCA